MNYTMQINIYLYDNRIKDINNQYKLFFYNTLNSAKITYCPLIELLALNSLRAVICVRCPLVGEGLMFLELTVLHRMTSQVKTFDFHYPKYDVADKPAPLSDINKSERPGKCMAVFLF